MAGDYRIEVLKGPPDPELSEKLVGFWTGRGVFNEAVARERLSKVVCVLFDDAGEIAGVNSADADMAPLVERRFWIYRRLVTSGVDAKTEQRMLEAATEELRRRFGAAPGEPVGVCLLISDRALMERHPEAVWSSGFVFAGYTDQNVQVRIRYFEGATI